MSLKPLNDKVVVKRASAKKSLGGILLPESAQEKPREGQVIAVGPGKRKEDGSIESMSLKVGDRVLFSSYAGTEFSEKDEEFLILSESEVLGVLS